MRKKAHMLKLMGIERWRERAEQKTPAFYCVPLCQHHETVGMLIADALLNNEAEKELVFAIAKSTHQDFSRDIILNQNMEWPASCKVIILLGKNCAFQVLQLDEDFESLIKKHHAVGEALAFVSYAPAALLEEPKRKVMAWECIKKAIARMS